MDAPNYNWQCQVCAASNPAGVAACSSCGFPAVATGKAIEAAKRALHPDAQQAKPQREGFLETLAATLEPLSSIRQLVAIGGLLAMLCGFVVFALGFSLMQIAVGIALEFAGAVGFVKAARIGGGKNHSNVANYSLKRTAAGRLR